MSVTFLAGSVFWFELFIGGFHRIGCKTCSSLQLITHPCALHTVFRIVSSDENVWCCAIKTCTLIDPRTCSSMHRAHSLTTDSRTEMKVKQVKCLKYEIVNTKSKPTPRPKERVALECTERIASLTWKARKQLRILARSR